MTWFMLAMVLYPEAQQKAQDEIDAIVGRGRLPSFEDFESLVYVRALFKETLRWHPVGPLGPLICIISILDYTDSPYIIKGCSMSRRRLVTNVFLLAMSDTDRYII